METKLKYIIYTRKSHESRDRQALSITSQVSELRDFARKEKLKVLRVLKESQTAFKPGRPVFGQMMEMLEMRLANAVLVWKPDRIARNALDGGRFIQAMDDGYLLELRSPFSCFRREDNRMMLYIHFGMSNDYSRQISANVRRGNREKYRRGEFVGKAPLGYLNAKVGNSRNIVPDPEKAPLIKRLFEEYATGKYSVVDMVGKADEWGLKSVFGKKIVKSGVYTLLRRTAYYGVYHHAGEDHQGTYDPLIKKGLFDKVQVILRNRSKPRNRNWVHAYKGLIKCSDCGCSITASTKVKHYKRTGRTASYTYYHCTKRRGGCNQQPVTEDELEDMIRDYISRIEIDREVWELGVELLEAKHSKEMKQNIEVSERLGKEKQEIDERLEKLLRVRLNEEITAGEYSKMKESLLDQKIKLKERLEDRDHSTNSWLELAENFFETAYQAREIMESKDFEKKRKLIQDVGWNLFLEDKKLRFSFKKPYDVLLKPHIREDVQGRRESNPQ